MPSTGRLILAEPPRTALVPSSSPAPGVATGMRSRLSCRDDSGGMHRPMPGGQWALGVPLVLWTPLMLMARRLMLLETLAVGASSTNGTPLLLARLTALGSSGT